MANITGTLLLLAVETRRFAFGLLIPLLAPILRFNTPTLLTLVLIMGIARASALQFVVFRNHII